VFIGTDAGRYRSSEATEGTPVAGPKEIKGYRLEPFAQCSGAILDHARLNAANLYSIDFRGASLREAQLAGAHVASRISKSLW